MSWPAVIGTRVHLVDRGIGLAPEAGPEGVEVTSAGAHRPAMLRPDHEGRRGHEDSVEDVTYLDAPALAVAPKDGQPLRLEADVRLFVAQDLVAKRDQD